MCGVPPRVNTRSAIISILVVNRCTVLQILHGDQKTFSSDVPMNPS
jgi:hypothetical protein